MPQDITRTEIKPLSESLAQVRFPISKEDLLSDYGHVHIQLVHGQVLSLSTALSNIIQPSFKSLSDLAIALGEHHRADEMLDW
ncbi:MAG TPA: hypothetical protein V6C99_00335 [Oculatellaceae cyanobacterium]|jgi:hypothetical protein